MQDFTSIDRLQDANVYDTNGDKVGSVGQVYLDDATNEPTFVTVKTGLFGMKETFVPLNQASQAQDGLTVPFDKDFIKDAPNVDADGSLTPEEEQRIYEYYSMDYTAGRGTRDGQDAGREHDAQRRDASTQTGHAAGIAGGAGVGESRDYPAGTVAGDRDLNRDRDLDDRAVAGRDVNDHAAGRGVNDEASMVVRDEHLDVHTERQATGEYRLRKHTYQDTETIEVPVEREEVVVERTPVDPNSAEARAADRGDDEVRVTTHEDVPVVDKNVTAEKVSLDKTAVQDTETVTETVQHEDVDIDRDVKRDGLDGKGRRA